MKLQTKKFGKRWWIVGNDDYGPIGPYETKQEAEDDRRGLNRFYRHQNEPNFVTRETIK